MNPSKGTKRQIHFASPSRRTYIRQYNRCDCCPYPKDKQKKTAQFWTAFSTNYIKKNEKNNALSKHIRCVTRLRTKFRFGKCAAFKAFKKFFFIKVGWVYLSVWCKHFFVLLKIHRLDCNKMPP